MELESVTWVIDALASGRMGKGADLAYFMMQIIQNMLVSTKTIKYIFMEFNTMQMVINNMKEGTKIANRMEMGFFIMRMAKRNMKVIGKKTNMMVRGHIIGKMVTNTLASLKMDYAMGLAHISVLMGENMWEGG